MAANLARFQSFSVFFSVGGLLKFLLEFEEDAYVDIGAPRARRSCRLFVHVAFHPALGKHYNKLLAPTVLEQLQNNDPTNEFQTELLGKIVVQLFDLNPSPGRNCTRVA